MKKLERQFVICEGQFNGGEIEPGTFHVHNAQSVSGSTEKTVGDDDRVMPDSDGENTAQDTRLGPVDVACY